uniref:C2H2-type domain-containing protein n=1 Tax=Megaselia scalaris TaxID=36166 RepID=T1GCV5_MEGSC
MTEFMNITELCRICMNAGVYLLSDQQLDMDGEEINSIDMLKEFSYNEFVEFDTKLRRGEENLLEYLTQSPIPAPQEDEIVSNDEYPDIETIPSVNSEETTDMIIQEQEDLKPINYEVILEVNPPPQKKRKTSTQSEAQSHKNTTKRFHSTAVDITDGETSYMVSAFLPSATVVKAPKACEPPKKSGAPDTSLSKTKVDEVRTIDYSVVRLSGAHDLDFEKHIPAETDTNTVYKCQYCPKAFANSYFLISHVKQVHVCQHCMATFPNRDELNDHTRSAHKSFECA